jgi:hypothetical protein
MEAIVHNTTSAYATRLRLRVPCFAGMPAWSGNGNPTVAFGSSMPSHGIADAGEQAWASLVFATGGDV